MEYNNVATTIKILRQRGRSNLVRDKGRYSRLPGKRVSRFGRTYWETRMNRSDAPGSKI